MAEYELYHYGVPGMKWGVRKASNNVSSGSGGTRKKKQQKAPLTQEQKVARRKKALKIGAAVAGTALAVYGAKKIHDVVRDKNTNIHIKNGYASLIKGLNGDKPLSPGDRMSLRNKNSYAFDMVKRNASAAAKRDSFGTALKNVVNDAAKTKGENSLAGKAAAIGKKFESKNGVKLKGMDALFESPDAMRKRNARQDAVNKLLSLRQNKSGGKSVTFKNMDALFDRPDVGKQKVSDLKSNLQKLSVAARSRNERVRAHAMNLDDLLDDQLRRNKRGKITF